MLFFDLQSYYYIKCILQCDLRYASRHLRNYETLSSNEKQISSSDRKLSCISLMYQNKKNRHLAVFLL